MSHRTLLAWCFWWLTVLNQAVTLRCLKTPAALLYLIHSYQHNTLTTTLVPLQCWEWSATLIILWWSLWDSDWRMGGTEANKVCKRYRFTAVYNCRTTNHTEVPFKYWLGLFFFISVRRIFLLSKSVCPFQLLSAFEQALQLTAHVPSEDHMELIKDYIKCLSKVSHLLCLLQYHVTRKIGRASCRERVSSPV